jgi:hypothetical protein
MMKLIIKVGNWTFELKQVFARKTEKFGGDFQASAVITITDGVPHIELLINKHDDKFTKQDYCDFQAFLGMLGIENAKYARFKNGIKKEVEKTV